MKRFITGGILAPAATCVNGGFLRNGRSDVAAFEGGVVVSCQAGESSPLRPSGVIASMAQAAVAGGAAGLRINGVADIRATRHLTDAPVIGLEKTPGRDRLMITTSLDAARELVQAGADVVAAEATLQAWGSLRNVAKVIRTYVAELGVPLMADVSTFEEGLVAWEAGASFVGTTLSGYTPYAPTADDLPDVDLVARLSERNVRVLAEGRYSTRKQLRSAFASGAHAVVIGHAITDPIALTRGFVEASPRGAGRTKSNAS